MRWSFAQKKETINAGALLNSAEFLFMISFFFHTENKEQPSVKFSYFSYDVTRRCYHTILPLKMYYTYIHTYIIHTYIL